MKALRQLWLVCFCLGLALSARAADSFVWDAKQSTLSAQVEEWPLAKLLEKVSEYTGWQVYVEPGTAFTASAKFKNLPIGEGLRALLGKLSFALVPQTNAPPTLYVFQTSRSAATQLVKFKPKPRASGAKPIPNELIVTIKPGASIDVIAHAVNAKVIGRVDGLNTYRLQFESPEAMEAALEFLNSNPDVVSIDYNYAVDNPVPKLAQLTGSPSDFNLQAKPLGSGNPVIIAAIDTGFDPSSYCGVSDFLLPGINVSGSSPVAGSAPAHGGAMVETILRSLALNSGGKTSVKVLPVDAYGANGSTTTFNVASAIYAAVNTGANIINMSLGSSGDSSFLHGVIIMANKQGVIFFGAAGNEPVTTPTYPAAYPEVVAVTAGNRDGTVASYANRGSFVSVVAPGNSAVCYNGKSWLVQGTSSATAVASGLAAAVADGSGKTPAQVIGIVTSVLPKPVTQ